MEKPPFKSDEEHLAWLETSDENHAETLTSRGMEQLGDGIMYHSEDGFGNPRVLFVPKNEIKRDYRATNSA
jgi:hypothetical protein